MYTASEGFMTVLQVAAAQITTGSDPVANLATATDAVRRAAAAGAELVALPEATLAAFGTDLRAIAEPLDGAFATGLRKVAAETGIVVIAGLFEPADDGRVHNTLLATGPDVEASYRKIHLYDAFGYRESDQLTPGDVAPVVVKIAGHKIGLMTCYDLRFPELSRALVDAGAEVLAVPAAWVRGPLKEHHWTTLLTARAIENTCYVAAAAQNGKKYSGLSQIIDPQGIAIAAAGEADGHALAEISTDRLTKIRTQNPSLQNRRYTVTPR
jgi:predicted amidohydrolase